MPVGFDRQAWQVSFDANHVPKGQVVTTSLPVLHFAGWNADASRIAYTSLVKVDSTVQGGFVRVSRTDAMNLTLNDLIPTGELVIEEGNETKVVTSKGVFVVSSAWHPTDPALIAYGYSRGDQHGIAVYNLSSGETREVMNGAVAPDVVSWSDDGLSVGAYAGDASLPRLTDGENTGLLAKRWTATAVLDGQKLIMPAFMDGGANFSLGNQSLEIAFKSGGHLALRDATGDPEASMTFIQNGKTSIVTFRADLVRHQSQNGIAFVNFDGGSMTLLATDGATAPLVIRPATAVTYFIPMHAGEKPVSFTQVGNGYPGGSCLLFDHTGKLAYAVDIQIESPYNGDAIIASANGTISSFRSTVTCNFGDLSGCADNTPSCGQDFGNYVIISHSDGRWTLYGHMEHANFQVLHTGVSVSRACWMGNEGHTGWTVGNKNGCGDHVHFQWQNSSSTGSQSIAGSFSDAPTHGSSSCTGQKPVTGIMSCVL